MGVHGLGARFPTSPWIRLLQAIDDPVRSEVEAAARSGVPRKNIIEVFGGRASRAAIYMWINQELDRLREISIPEIQDPPPPVHNVVVNLPSPTTIAYLEILQANLSRLEAMLALSIRDGQIRNPRLALDVTREIGAQLSRAARINAEIQDVEAQRRFLRALADVIHEEPPEVRDRLVRKMREIGAGGGIL